MARLLVVENSGELAALIAAAAGSRGHHAKTAFTGESALALAQAETFDVAVVNLTLPDIPGIDVLRELEGRRVPCIAVAARAERAQKPAEARALFERPFPMAALLQAVEAVFSPPLELGPEDEVVPEPLSEGSSAPRPKPETPPPEELLAIDDEYAALAAQAAAQASAFDAGFNGPLSPGIVPRLLLAIARERDTAQLLLRSQGITLRVDLRDGQPVSVESNRPEESFTEYCIQAQQISEDTRGPIAEAVARGSTEAEAMAQLGLLSPNVRAELEAAHVRAIVYSAFYWSDGDYAVARLPAQALLPIQRDGPRYGDFVFVGLLQPQPLEWLREALPAERRLHPTPEAAFVHHQISLNAAQANLLAQADDSKTVSDLVVLSDLPETEALLTLLAFAQLGLLEVRSAEARSRRVSFGL